MPGESNLIRLYYVGEVARNYPEAKIWIAHPKDTNVVQLMIDELQIRGVDSAGISLEMDGNNTREQAVNLKEKYPELLSKRIAIVSSPEHLFRTMLVFRKLGYQTVGGVPAFENAMFVPLGYNHKKIGGKRYVPDVSGQLSLRYNFWNYLKLEIICLREFVAIGYYQLNDWI